VLQRHFEPNDRYLLTEKNKKIEKFITRFYARRAYSSQIVLTNFTSQTLEVEVLY